MSNWIERIGVGNGKGEVSFNKTISVFAMGVFVFAVVYSLTSLRQQPPWFVWSFGVIVIGSGFGLKGYLAGVARRNESFTQSDTTTVNTSVSLTGDVSEIVKAVTERRSGGDTEPTL